MPRIATALLGALLGGLVGGGFVFAATIGLKRMMDLVSTESTVEVIVVPLAGLALATVVLHVIGRTAPHGSAWRTFPAGAVRADITGDVVDSAGAEEHFPWRLAPLRMAAIFATVGLGAAMGTEAPAAYLGVAAGACIGDRGRKWRLLLRPAALAAGAAGVSAVMGVAAVGTLYMLELGRRNRAPLNAERVIAAVIGGLAGWGINYVVGITVIRLIVPHESPADFLHGVKIAVFIGGISGAITAVAGSLIYRAKKWRASPMTRLAIGGLALAATALLITAVAVPTAAVGPGGRAIVWAEDAAPVPLALLAVALLRGAATISAVLAGGCGGIFVPFLAIGDIAGRVVAPGLDISSDLAASAGAAAGIASGYRLPFTAVAMSLGVGGSPQAVLTCLAAIAIAALVGTGAGSAIEWIWKPRHA